MYYVYILRNIQSEKIYIGQTRDLENRIRQHNERGFYKASYTKINKGVWILVYKEVLGTRLEALKREKQLKSFRGREFIKNQLAR